jgi:hypothetical protein
MRMEGKPGEALPEVWAYLTPEEASELLAALTEWASESSPDPGWHTHVGERGSELTIAIGEKTGSQAETVAGDESARPCATRCFANSAPFVEKERSAGALPDCSAPCGACAAAGRAQPCDRGAVTDMNHACGKAGC